MNHYKPLEKRDEHGNPSGTFHMCMINGDFVIAVGYCANGCNHKSEIEAADCYRQYNIDKRCKLDSTETYHHSQCMCEGCEEITNKHAEVGIGIMHHMFRLCDKHRNIEEIKKLLRFGQGFYLYGSY